VLFAILNATFQFSVEIEQDEKHSGKHMSQPASIFLTCFTSYTL